MLSDSCSFLTGVQSCGVVAHPSTPSHPSIHFIPSLHPGPQRILRCFSAHHVCKEWLRCPSCQLEPVCSFSSDLSHRHGVSACRTDTHWPVFFFCFCLFVFHAILHKLYRSLCVKISGPTVTEQAFLIKRTPFVHFGQGRAFITIWNHYS